MCIFLMSKPVATVLRKNFPRGKILGGNNTRKETRPRLGDTVCTVLSCSFWDSLHLSG